MAKNRRKQTAGLSTTRTSIQQRSKDGCACKGAALENSSLNPFELKWSRQKHKVAGRDKLQAQRRTPVGKPVKSRARAIEYRRNTLLSEWKKRNRKSDFQDKRLGEHDATMTLEDKMLERFAHQRKKKAGSDSTRFHLTADVDDDRDAEDMVPSWPLRKIPASLHTEKRIEQPDIDTVWDAQKSAGGSMQNTVGPFDVNDENLNDNLGEQYVSREHFGGGLLQRRNESSLTHDQRINELIAESKREKYEKQKAKDEVIGMTDDLDSQWQALLHDGLNVLTMYERRPKCDTNVASVAHENTSNSADTKTNDVSVADGDDDQEYDEAYKMLQLNEKPKTLVKESIIVEFANAKHILSQTKSIANPQLSPTVHTQREDSAASKFERERLVRQIAAADAHEQMKSLSGPHVGMLKAFPGTFRAFRTNFATIPVESRVAALGDLLVMYHPSLDEHNNKRVERLLSFVMLYVLTSNEYQTFELLRELGPLLARLWNFSVTSSLPQISKYLTKVDADTDGCAPHGGHLAFLQLLTMLVSDSAVEFSRHENDHERRSEQYASHDILWKSTMLIIEKLVRKSARGRCAVFKCLFAISMACNLLKARHQQSINKTFYSTALTTALERLANQVIPFLHAANSAVESKDVDSLLPAKPKNILQELFIKDSSWPRSAVLMCFTTIVQLTRQLMQMWRSLGSIQTIFSPTIDAVRTAKSAVVITGDADTSEIKLFHYLSDELIHEYSALKPKKLTRLHFLRQKPKPLPLLEPKLDVDDKSRSEKKQCEKRQSLKRAVRKELIGAKREIRRDNQFLARQQLTLQSALDEQRKYKLKELLHGLQTQEHEHKTMEKQKRRFKNNKKRIRL